MARYIDVEGYRKLFDEEYKKTRKLISDGETHLDNLAEGFSEASRVIDRMPTADVVPKSKYDLAVTEREANVKGFTEEIAKVKAEVAREIFEEIEFDIHQLMFERDETRSIAIEGIIAASKKKYTEVKDDT